MTMLRCDSFDYYNTSQITRRYSSTAVIAPAIGATGRNGSSALQIAHTNTAVDWTFPSNIAEGFDHFAVNAGTSSVAFFYLVDNATVQLTFYLKSDRKIEVRRGTSTVLGTTSGALPATGTYAHLQIHWKIHSSTGVVRILIDDVEVLNLTGQNTQNSGNAYATVHRWGDNVLSGSTGITAWHFDDFVFNDTGGSDNNTLLGDRRVVFFPADAEGATSDFTPSTGTDNAALVDENPANDDTDYIESSTVGHIDYVTLDVSPAIPTGAIIDAVAVVTTDRKTDGGTRTARHKIRFGSGPTVANGADFSPSTSYTIHQTIFENAITVSEINAPMQVGVEVQS